MDTCRAGVCLVLQSQPVCVSRCVPINYNSCIFHTDMLSTRGENHEHYCKMLWAQGEGRLRDRWPHIQHSTACSELAAGWEMALSEKKDMQAWGPVFNPSGRDRLFQVVLWPPYMHGHTAERGSENKHADRCLWSQLCRGGGSPATWLAKQPA